MHCEMMMKGWQRLRILEDWQHPDETRNERLGYDSRSLVCVRAQYGSGLLSVIAAPLLIFAVARA